MHEDDMRLDSMRPALTRFIKLMRCADLVPHLLKDDNYYPVLVVADSPELSEQFVSLIGFGFHIEVGKGDVIDDMIRRVRLDTKASVITKEVTNNEQYCTTVCHGIVVTHLFLCNDRPFMKNILSIISPTEMNHWNTIFEKYESVYPNGVSLDDKA